MTVIFIIAISIVLACALKVLVFPDVKWVMVGAAVALSGLVTFGVDYIGSNAAAWDTETWNGSISAKNPEKRSCQTGWSRSQDSFCTEYRTRTVEDGQTCSTDKDGKQSCITLYATEYKYDFSWERRYFLESKNLNTYWEIDRIDRQGKSYPPKFEEAQVGDPTSITNSYNNWVRAASDSVFHEDGKLEDKYATLLPTYPQVIYDQYKMDRILAINVDIPNLKEYNRLLSVALSDLGPKKQMNAIIVLVDAAKAPIDYAYAVRRHWMGFKKNDAVIFIGVNPDKSVNWAEVLSWSKNSIFNIELRDDIRAMKGELDLRSVILRLYHIGMDKYERRSMKEFEFLRDQIPTNPFSIGINLFFNILIIVGGLMLANKLERR
jgi:hypothetical protein